MRTAWSGLRAASLTALALALATGLGAQSTGSNTPAASAPAAQPAAGTTPVGGDATQTDAAKQTSTGTAQTGTAQTGTAQTGTAQASTAQASTSQTGTNASVAAPTAEPAPGTAPVGGDNPASEAAKTPADSKAPTDSKTPAPGTTPVGGDTAATDVNPEKVIEPGSQKINVKPGSIEDVNAVGNRDIGARGIGNWYSVDTEIKMGKMYATEIEKSTKFITDPVVEEYVNRVGQNIVKNSDCKVPFTIKVIDSDEINAMALPGGFFYVNSGLILNADEEAELAGVMAHEVAHVCAHHAVREQTRMNYAQLSTIPLIFIGGWTGYGIYEAAGLAVPMTFLKFSRDFEAQADYLGVQYMYRAGYDPQAFISFFEKVQALEKRKPGLVAKAFSDHPQTPDRILHTQEEIARILPPRDEYTVTTSEFDDIKARLARIENKRRLTDTKDKNRPSLRRASAGSSDPNSTASSGDSSDDGPPTLHRREDQN